VVLDGDIGQAPPDLESIKSYFIAIGKDQAPSSSLPMLLSSPPSAYQIDAREEDPSDIDNGIEEPNRPDHVNKILEGRSVQ
jgi:hypothetical protein